MFPPRVSDAVTFGEAPDESLPRRLPTTHLEAEARAPRQMIIVVNGPFGVSKSTTAHLLVQRLPNSFVYDPELIGFVLRSVAWQLIRVRDYQDLAVWRGLTTCGAWALRRTGRTLVVPNRLMKYTHFGQLRLFRSTGLRR